MPASRCAILGGMKYCLLSVAALLAAHLIAATAVKTVHPTRDLVVAERVLAPAADPRADYSATLQGALDAVGKLGGGTVFLPAGHYTLAKPVELPVGVTLRGDFCREEPAKGTVLRIVGGRGDEEGPAAFTEQPGSALIGLVFWYPEQDLADPKPYPWTIRTTRRAKVANDGQAVFDCVLVNAWRGIAIGPEWNELHTFRNVRICALKTGFAVDSVTDIGRVSECAVSPSVWAASGLPGAPAAGVLADWLRARETVGADYGRSDWEFIWRLRVEGYRTGVRFRKGARGLTNAVMADCDVRDCGVALDVAALNGVGLAVYDCRLAGAEASVRLAEKLDSVVQFHHCEIAGKAPEKDDRSIVVKGEGIPVKAETAPFRAPAVRDLFDVAAFGASPSLDDNAGAFRKALDAAAAKGGTVYVPAGYYRFKGNLRVPAGVELRGCTDAPHHTCSGGSVLMPLQGRGEESGEPFVSLAPGAGLRGLGFWYPEQTFPKPVPYPWTVRSLGPGCWVRDVNIGNGWQGVDFATNPSDGHVVSYLSGCCWRRALQVGRSAGTGWVEDLQFNPHYAARRAPGLPVPASLGKIPGDGAVLLRTQLEGFVFRDCADERVRGTFLYAARDGIAFHGRNRAEVLIHGTDTGARAWVLAQAEGSELRAALAQLVPYESPAEVEKGAVMALPGDAGASTFHASQFWVDRPTLVQRGRGSVELEVFNSLSGPVVVAGGAVRVADGQFRLGLPAHAEVTGGSARIECCSMRGGAFKVRDPGRRADCRGLSFSPQGRTGLLPDAPPKDFLLDCEPGSPVQAIEGRIAERGGLRKFSDWSCRVVPDGERNHAVRFRGKSDDPSYSFLYCQVAAPDVPVYPDTVLTYRLKPLNAKGREVTLDLLFTDGAVLRESGVAPGGVRKAEADGWIRCRVGLAVRSVMVRYDSRAGGEPVDALVDDIRLETPNPRENWSARAVLRDGVVTFDPPYPHRAYYTLDGRSVGADAASFTGSLRLPPGTREFRWSPSLRDGTPSGLEFPLEVLR